MQTSWDRGHLINGFERVVFLNHLSQGTKSGVITGDDMNLFPELNINVLNKIALRWVADYGRSDFGENPIEFDRILLYGYATPRQRYYNETDPTQYAIVFELLYHRKITDTININDPLEKFINDTQYYGAPPEKSSLIYGDFNHICNHFSDKYFYKKWRFIPKHIGFELPDQVRVEEGVLVLYDRKVSASPRPDTTSQLSILPQSEAEKTQKDIKKSKRFIRGTKFRYTDNQGVEIKTPGKRWVYVLAGEGGLDFSKTTNDPVQWGHFLSMLQNTDHLFDLGKSRIGEKKEGSKQKKNPEYFSRTQVIKNIDTKLVTFFKANYPHLILPQNYTIVEKAGVGVRRFKFQIEDQNTWQIDNRSPETRKKELKKLWGRYKKTKDGGLYERILKTTTDLVVDRILKPDDEMVEDLKTISEEKVDFGSSL